MHAKDPYEAKYQYLINIREGVGLKHFNDPEAFVKYSNDMGNVYKNIDEYNPDKELWRFQRMLDWILLTFLSWKYLIKESFNKLCQIISWILGLKILVISTENVLLNHILF